MTPLADVMLVLLIIFMVVTPMLPKGVAVRLPPAAHPTEHPDDETTVVLAITEDGTVWLNQESIPAADVGPRLASLLAETEQDLLYVKASESLDYGFVLEMMDACRRAGAEGVALLTRAIERPPKP